MSDAYTQNMQDDDLTEEELALVELVEELLGSIADLDREEAFSRARALPDQMTEEDFVDVCAYLTEIHHETDEEQPGVKEPLALLLDVLVDLGQTVDHEVFVSALLERSGNALALDNPIHGYDLASRALEVARQPDDVALAHMQVAWSWALRSEGERALSAARSADSTAESSEVRRLARAQLLGFSVETRPWDVTKELVLTTLAWEEDPEVSSMTTLDLGRALIDALATFFLDLDAADLDGTVEETNAAAVCLTHPEWFDDTILNRAELACLAAWSDHSRNDLSRIGQLLSIAVDEEITEPALQTVAAMLRASVNASRLDLAGAEEEMHRAAIAASGNPELARLVSGPSRWLESTMRGGQVEAPGGNLAQEDDSLTTLALVARVINAWGSSSDLSSVPVGVTQDVEAWCATPHVDESASEQALGWALAGLMSVAVHRDLAAERLDRARGFVDSIPVDLGTALPAKRFVEWVESMVAATAPAQEPEALGDFYTKLVEGGGAESVRFAVEAQLQVLALHQEQPLEAVHRGVSALFYLWDYQAGLRGSSERKEARTAQRRLLANTVKAAAQTGQTQLLAEVLELIRAQEMPHAAPGANPDELPLGILLSQARQSEDTNPFDEFTDAVRAPRTRPIMMPWGRIAASDSLPPQRPPPVPLVVPRVTIDE